MLGPAPVGLGVDLPLEVLTADHRLPKASPPAGLLLFWTAGIDEVLVTEANAEESGFACVGGTDGTGTEVK